MDSTSNLAVSRLQSYGMRRYNLYRTHPSVLRESISDVEVLGNDVNVIHRLTRSRFLENISGWPSGVLNSGKLGCPRFLSLRPKSHSIRSPFWLVTFSHRPRNE